MNVPGYDGRRAAGPLSSEAIQEISRLRRLAWSTLVAVEGASGLDDAHDCHAIHWPARRGGTLVAAAQLCVHPRIHSCPDGDALLGAFRQPPIGPVASINRLVIHLAHRGRGLSRALDLERIRFARDIGARCVMGWTWGRRIAGLERLGFDAIGIGRSRAPAWQRLARSVESVVLCLDLEIRASSGNPVTAASGEACLDGGAATQNRTVP